MNDRRAMQRFNLKLAALINCECLDQGTIPIEECVTSNICAGGAYFIVSEPLQVGTEVRLDLSWPPAQLKLDEPHKNLIKLSGAVVRSDADGMAVSFRNNFKFIATAD